MQHNWIALALGGALAIGVCAAAGNGPAAAGEMPAQATPLQNAPQMPLTAGQSAGQTGAGTRPTARGNQQLQDPQEGPALPSPRRRAAAALNPIRLEDVLSSVDRSYPVLLATLEEMAIAEARFLAAKGEFDTKVKAGFDIDPVGTYVNHRYNAGVEQPTTWWGSSFFGGWRLGTGSYPAYDGKLETLDSGEWKLGFRVPLLRDGAIDRRRAEIQRSDLGRTVASAGIDAQRLSIYQAATRTYWDWVAAGREYSIAKELLDIAETRNTAIAEAVDLGQIPAIELTDNRRAILQRRSQVVVTDRRLQQAAIRLSMFYRDNAGQPVLLPNERLPAGFPDPNPVDAARMQEDIQLAVQRRPEIVNLNFRKEQSVIELRLARNQTKPNVDVGGYAAKDTGTPNPKVDSEVVEFSLNFDLPVQRRKAIGKAREEEARIRQFDQQLQFARDRITAEVQDAYSAVITAFDALKLASEEVVVSRQLEEAERTRFDLGDSTLFIVNLREQTTADAAIREVRSLATYYSAVADYEASIAETLSRPRP